MDIEFTRIYLSNHEKKTPKSMKSDHVFSLFIFSTGIYSSVESYTSIERVENKLSKNDICLYNNPIILQWGQIH